MAAAWTELLRNSEKTCIIQDASEDSAVPTTGWRASLKDSVSHVGPAVGTDAGRRKIHFTLLDGRELAEEYDLQTNELIIRKWKKKGTLGGTGRWDYEVGEQLAPVNLEVEGLLESNTNVFSDEFYNFQKSFAADTSKPVYKREWVKPIFVRKDTKTAFQWRVRNIPYPVEIYSVTCDEDQNIIIRTSNKKYYKKFRIPDMERCSLPLEQSNISVAHANNTLIVSYNKPKVILDMEKNLQKEFSKLKASKDGDVDCTPS